MTFQASDGVIYKQTHYGELGVQTDVFCTIDAAVEAFKKQQKGPGICENFGHDFTLFISHNMWSCFRCGEPGWEVPIQ